MSDPPRTNAELQPDWEKTARDLVEYAGSGIEAVALAESAVSLVCLSLHDAVVYALKNEEDWEAVRLWSGYSQARLVSCLNSKTPGVEGDIAAWRTAYFETFDNLLAVVAYANLNLGIPQAQISRVCGYSPSTISDWVREARNVGAHRENEHHD